MKSLLGSISSKYMDQIDRHRPLIEVGGSNRHSNRHTTEVVQGAFKILMTHIDCVSHDVSHFAAFFIVVGTKTSVAESVL